MVDTLESAAGLGLVVQPRPIEGKTQRPLAMSKVNRGNFDSLLEAWIPLTLSMNTLNRSMGLIDGYPFVLTQTVIEKLRFVHDVIQQASQRSVMQERVARWWREELGTRPTSPEPPALQTSSA
jgi:hypothetical protein